MNGLDGQTKATIRGRAQGLIIALIATLIVIFPGAPIAANASIVHNDIQCDLSVGDGSDATPYLIGSAEELFEVTDCDGPSVVFRLTNNIDMSGATNSPIGFSQSADPGTSSSGKIFSGIIDGDNFGIYNISLSSDLNFPYNATTSDLIEGFGEIGPDGLNGLGLFWMLGSAVFQDLSISGQVNYSGGGFTSQYFANVPATVGLLAGYASYVSFSNVTANASISSTLGVAGGLVGVGWLGAFENVLMSGTVEVQDLAVGPNLAGGLIGYSIYSGYQNVSSSVDVSAPDLAGGLAALVFQASVSNSSNFGSITGGDDTGGLIGGFPMVVFSGATGSSVVVFDSSNYGTVNGVARVGGLIGTIGDANIHDSHNYGAVSGGQGAIGGLAGYVANYSTVSSSSNNATVSAGYDMVGGILGSVGVFATIEDSTNSGNVTGEYGDIGGLVGEAGNVNIQRSHNTGNVLSPSSGNDNVGGLVGYISDSEQASIWSSSNTGSIYGGDDHVGGLVGFVDSIEILYSNNSGRVEADDEDAGGLVGDLDSIGYIIYSANSGEVISDDDGTGGLVGNGTNVYIYYSYNTGTVSGGTDVGGLIGDGYSFYLYETFNSGQISSTYNSGGLIGEVFGSADISNSYNSGSLYGSNVGGLVGFANVEIDVHLTNTYNSGSVSGSEIEDGLVANVSEGHLFLVSSYTFIPTVRTTPSTIEQMRTLELYANWNFNSVWGFGTCEQNSGLPLLRFVGDYSYSSVAGCEAEAPVEVPNIANYDGPIIQFVSPKIAQGQPGLVRGTKLNQVEQIFVGNKQATFKLNADGTIAFDTPADLAPGRYEVRFLIPRLGVSLYGSVQVGTTVDKVVNAGSFRGYVALYVKGYEGSRVTAKVGNDWVIIPKVPTNGLFRVVEYTGAGYSINVRIFVDRVLVRTINLTTK